jgi:hypothetical protein
MSHVLGGVTTFRIRVWIRESRKWLGGLGLGLRLGLGLE